MADKITHRHVSAIPDDPSADVGSGEWNDSLTVSGGTADGQPMERSAGASDGWIFGRKPIAGTGITFDDSVAGQRTISVGQTGFVSLTPPDDSLFSWVNQGSASVVVTTGKAIFLNAPALTGNNFRGRVMSAPATPYTLTVGIIPAIVDFNFAACGVFFRESGSGKLAPFQYANNTTKQMIPQKYTNPTTFSANYSTTNYTMMGAIMWFRIKDDGTNRVCYISNDGLNFKQIHTVGRTDFLTADQVGFGADSSNTTLDVGMTVVSWSF